MATANNVSMLKYLWISVAVIIADQATKWIANTQLDYHMPVPVIPYLEWYLSYNPGAAFSFLANADGWQRWFFTAIAIVVSAVLLVWIKNLKAEEKVTAIALSLILGGAIGNLIDRLLLGHVIDFIQVWLGSYPWPAFNVADSAIFVGAVMLILSGMISPYKTEHDKDPAP
ncbi:MAG: signal peptidase II [Gammaproteobacteria bacterium]|nr:signal peptidase II [Gammaproteobacteria bacterium]